MMYPMRYDASVPYRNEQAVILLNEIMHLLERDNPDLILLEGNLLQFPMRSITY